MAVSTGTPASEEATPPRTRTSPPPPPVHRDRALSLVWGILAKGFVLLGMIFLIAPLVAVFLASFNPRGSVRVPPTTWTLESYSNISPRLYEAFVVSVQVGLMATLLAILLVVPSAFGLVRGLRRGRVFAEATFRSPIQVPQIVLGVSAFAFFFLLGRELGIPLVGSTWGLVLAHVILVSPFIISTVLASVQSLDPEMELAAKGLGASSRMVIWRVLVPAIRQSVLAAALLSFLISFDNVPVSLFLSGSGATTLPVALFFESLTDLTPALYAGAALTVLVTLVITMVVDRILGLRKTLR